MAGRPRAKLITGNFDLSDDRQFNLAATQRGSIVLAEAKPKIKKQKTKRKKPRKILLCPHCAFQTTRMSRHMRKVQGAAALKQWNLLTHSSGQALRSPVQTPPAT